MKTLYIHAGAHKTASSMLQSALRIDKDELLRKGLRVVFRSQMINRKLQECLYRISKNEFDANTLLELDEDLEKLLPKRDIDCLITNEDIFSTIDLHDFYRNIDVSLQQIRKTANRLGWGVKLIFYTRSQADYIESVYLQHIHLGRALCFDDFLKGEIPTFLSWRSVVDEAVSVLGNENVIIEPFENIKIKGGERFYLDFLRSVGVSDFDGIDFESDILNSRGANRSYSMLGVEIARKVNPLLNKEEKKFLRNFLQENFSTATHERASFLDVDKRHEVMDFYSLDNKELFDKYLNESDPFEMGYCVGEGK